MFSKFVLYCPCIPPVNNIYVNNKDIVNNETHTTLPMNGNVVQTVHCENQPNPEG